MTLYELYDSRVQHAVVEATYGKGLWAWINDWWAAYWKHRLDNSAVGALEKELAVMPRRSMKNG